MKKISFKILVVLCVIVIIASTSLFLVSAELVSVPEDDEVPQFGFDVEWFEVKVSDGTGVNFAYDVEFTKIYSDMYRYKVSLDTKLVAGNDYSLNVYLKASPQYVTTDYKVLGSYEIWLMRNDNYSVVNNNLSCFRTGTDSPRQSATKVILGESSHSDPFPMCKVFYESQELNTSYDFYHTSFNFRVNNSTTTLFYFYLSEVDFKLVDPSVDAIIQNQNENTDKILNAGDDVPQPDFDNTNDSIDNTVGKINSIEGQYKIDADATQSALSEGNNFILGTDMQKASIQVKNWIERFGSENIVISGFLVAAMVLGLCFWVIGRKSF